MQFLALISMQIQEDIGRPLAAPPETDEGTSTCLLGPWPPPWNMVNSFSPPNAWNASSTFLNGKKGDKQVQAITDGPPEYRELLETLSRHLAMHLGHSDSITSSKGLKLVQKLRSLCGPERKESA